MNSKCLFCLVLVLSVNVVSLTARVAPDTDIRLYGSDPDGAFNQLHSTLYLRKGLEGEVFGADQLDPLLWTRSQFLLEPQSNGLAITALTRALDSVDELERLSLLQRAILQRDLWSIFDSVATRTQVPRSLDEQRLLQLLATLIKQVSLSEVQLATLRIELEARLMNEPSLKEILATWVPLKSKAEFPIGATHASFFGGRSTFLVFMKAPNGAGSISSYLEKLNAFPSPLLDPQFPGDNFPPLNPGIPQFEEGTEFALVRLANLITREGNIEASALVEQFQTMKFSKLKETGEAQEFKKSILSRVLLFFTDSLGLRSLGPKDQDFPQFLSHGFDPFEQERYWKREVVLKSCKECHTSFGDRKLVGIQGVQSFARDFRGTLQTPRVNPLEIGSPSIQFDLTRKWKIQTETWATLKKLGF